MEWALVYVALGAFSGFVAGLFGVGGGLLLVPALMFLFDAQQLFAENSLHLALGTSMAAIVFTSVASARKHHHHGAVNWQVVRNITPGILVGAGIGAWSTGYIPARPLGIFFALFVLFAAAQILLNVRPKPSRQLPGTTGLGLVGAATGWISSLVSIGGGTIVVPFLVWCNVALRNAIGTSAAIGFPVAVGGTIGYVITGINVPLPANTLGFVYLPASLWVASASMLTAPLGAIAAHRLKVELLRKLFALLLLILAAKLLVRVI